jgi:hypothetical protein
MRVVGKLENDGNEWTMFQIYDYPTSNIKLAMAVSSATQIKTDLLDLEPNFEHFILNHFKPIIGKTTPNLLWFMI